MKISDYDFDEPWIMGITDFANRAAVYVILSSLGNENYGIIYVGETEGLEERLTAHEKYECWIRNSDGPLYVAAFWTPRSQYTDGDRRAVEKELRDLYDPPCNRQ